MSSAARISSIGVVGVGRLGRSLCLRLRDRFDVYVHDRDIRMGKQFAKQNGLQFRYLGELSSAVEAIVLCVPANEVPAVLRCLELGDDAPPPCLDTATALDTTALADELALERVRVLGCKPIGQFVAIRYGLPCVFVTASVAEDEQALLRAVAGPLGEVLAGDEAKVGEINRVATELALRFCVAFDEALQELGAEPAWRRSALRSVAVGTILDFPPRGDNGYATELLERIATGTTEGRR
jgi:pyrroline-5-carboxylate reductase